MFLSQMVIKYNKNFTKCAIVVKSKKNFKYLCIIYMFYENCHVIVYEFLAVLSVVMLYAFCAYAVSYTHLTLPTNREV